MHNNTNIYLFIIWIFLINIKMHFTSFKNEASKTFTLQL